MTNAVNGCHSTYLLCLARLMDVTLTLSEVIPCELPRNHGMKHHQLWVGIVISTSYTPPIIHAVRPLYCFPFHSTPEGNHFDHVETLFKTRNFNQQVVQLANLNKCRFSTAAADCTCRRHSYRHNKGTHSKNTMFLHSRPFISDSIVMIISDRCMTRVEQLNWNRH